MNIIYEQKYLKYKEKYMNLKHNGGSYLKKAQERKEKEFNDKVNLEKNKKILEAWEKIKQTTMFIADVEMLVSMEDKNVEEAVEIIKNKIITEEETKQTYYTISSIKEYMDLLGLKPNTEIIKKENFDNDFY